MPAYRIVLHIQEAVSRTGRFFTRACVCRLGHYML